MKDREDFSKVITEISILYELSLAAGQSLDLQTNCDRFLKTLMARKNLGYSSVWIKGKYLVDLPEEIPPEDRDENSAFLVYANPEFPIKEKSIPPHHLIFSMLEGKEAFSIASTEDRFSEIITEKGIDKGIFAIFSLGKLGFLKLFSMMGKTPFGEEELNQLNNVISKFTISLEGCIAHQKVTQEISERKQVEEALRMSEEAAKRIAQENAIMAEIGKIISSSLNIDEVYERFTKEVAKLISFDRIMINIVNPENNTTSFAYIAGIDVPDRRVGDITPLKGTATFECMRTRSSMLIQPEDIDECLARFPALLPTFQAGLRSIIFVPLISKDQFIGILSLRSFKPKAYTDQDVRLTESIANQIAGAIANAQLFVEVKRTEEALRESETQLRLITDALPVLITYVDSEQRYRFNNKAYEEWFGYSFKESYGKHIKEVLGDQTYQAIRRYVERALSGQPVTYETVFPYKSGGTRYVNVTYIPHFGEKGGVKGYFALVSDITERKRAEELLHESEEAARRLAQENAIMAMIGRIINSTLNIEEVYERFAEEVRKLIPFDRIVIQNINPKDNTTTIDYISGIDVESRRFGDIVPIFGTATGECIRTSSSLLFQTESIDEVVNRFPGLLPTFKAGLRSMIFVPLISKDQVIGVLSLRATKPNAYTEGDLRLAERVGNQIAGAIANAQLFAEHKHTEEALRESEERFKELYDNAPIGYHEFDTEGRITNVNRTDLEMLGYTAEEMIGQPMWKFIVEEEIAHERILAKLAGTLPVGRAFERSYRRKDGTTFPVLIKDRLILDEKGRIKGIRCTIQDITGIKKTEEALRMSEEEAKRVAQENAIMAEIGRIISSTLNIDEVYERFAEEVRKFIPFDRIVINVIDTEKSTVSNVYMAGKGIADRKVDKVYPLKGSGNAEMVRTQSSLLIQTEDFNEYKDRLPMLLSTFQAGFRSIMNVPLFSKGRIMGGLLLRSLKPYAYTDKDVRLAERVGNQIAGAIANAQLFTERKQAEEALRKTEERFRELYDNAPVGYHEYDTEGRITQVNRTELEMLGYTAEEMLGQPVWKFIVEKESQERVKAKLAGDTPSGKAFERTYRRKDGTTFPVLIEDRLLRDSEGRITGIRSTIQDFTERKRIEKEMAALEEQLRQSQRIEAIGKLAGGVAHDFNNLLTVIKGYSELLLIKLKEGDPLKGNIEEIHRASQRATDLTRQLLAFSRRQILAFKVLDLNTVLQDMDKMLHRLIGEDIELVYLLSDHLGKVRTDPGQIEQVILNLTVNARDAMPSGGKLTIETANVELDETYAHIHIEMKPGRYVMLSVSDTGCGMSPEVKEHLFEPFFTTKEKGKGTGLGLSTVYGIVKQSEGDVWVYSEPGQGTAFKIYLPRVEEEASALPHGDDKDSLPRGRETVLLVEDELSVRGLAVQVLRENGYNLLEAANGIEALRMAQEYAGEIHLLLTDVVMPQMGGKELADRLKPLRPDIKVLFTSGYTDNAIVHHGVLEPGIDFLQKPFSPVTLTQKVRKVLDK